MSTKTNSKVIQLSTTEKVMYGLGTILLFGGGFIWYKKSQKDKEQDAATDYGNENANTQELPANAPVKNPTNPTYATPSYVDNTTTLPVENAVIRDADKFGYKYGQEVMSHPKNGTQTYVPKKNADKTFETDGKKQTYFQPGDPIGIIVWVGKKPNGTFRYVVKRVGRTGIFPDSFHWIADTRHIKPINKNLGTFENVSYDVNKLLKFGSKGDEVKELQKRLKISVDKVVGIFGKNTRNALMQQKKLSEIRLKDWK